ncbi:hypothetical protein FOZ63_001256, partial [Perkinsus olseni]
MSCMHECPPAIDDAWDALIRVATTYVDDPHAFLLEVYKSFADHLMEGYWSTRQSRVCEYISQGFSVMDSRYDGGDDQRPREQLLEDYLYDLALVNSGIREDQRAERKRRKRAAARAEREAEPSQPSGTHQNGPRRHPLVHGPSTGRKVSASFDSDDDDDDDEEEEETTEETEDSDRPTQCRETNRKSTGREVPENTPGSPRRDAGERADSARSREPGTPPEERRRMPVWMVSPRPRRGGGKWT